MSTTAFQRLATGLVGVLLAAPALASGHIKANPTRAWPADVQQAIAVRLGPYFRTSSDSCGDHWRVSIKFECSARAATGTDPAEAVDALISAVADRIAAADLSSFSVIERGPEASGDPQFDAADTPAASDTLTLTFTVHTATDRLTPTTP